MTVREIKIGNYYIANRDERDLEIDGMKQLYAIVHGSLEISRKFEPDVQIPDVVVTLNDCIENYLHSYLKFRTDVKSDDVNIAAAVELEDYRAKIASTFVASISETSTFSSDDSTGMTILHSSLDKIKRNENGELYNLEKILSTNHVI